MRFAVLSDVHGNLEALQAVLADARQHRCTHFVCLGDIVGYNADPSACIRIVRELDCPTVKGNHDEQASLSDSSVDFNEMAEQAIMWTRAQLSEQDRSWLRCLPLQQSVHDFTIVHATLNDPGDWGYVFTTTEAMASFAYQQTALCFFGHTHVQGAFIRNVEVTPTVRDKIGIDSGKQYLVNAGSVGQPRDGDWRAAYCIYLPDDNLVEQRRVPYEIDRTRKKVLAAGLPRLLADRLVLGR
ncbi:MAG: metallophosphoesterase [Verrucomicrobia bacterium]|nr:MAG: metallophosphoesterase [Verrucomicrobiota bacterium]